MSRYEGEDVLTGAAVFGIAAVFVLFIVGVVIATKMMTVIGIGLGSSILATLVLFEVGRWVRLHGEDYAERMRRWIE